MPEHTDRSFCNVELRPTSSPHITLEAAGLYWIEWESPSIAVMVSLDQLRELVAEAMIAQAGA